MAKKVTEKQLKALEHIKEWCFSIIHFMTKIGGENPIFTQYEEVITDSYQKQNLKGLRYCLRDVNEWAKGLSQNDVTELNSLLMDKFGENLNKGNDKLKTIIKRGKINSDVEYQLLQNRVEEIHDSNKGEKEVETLNKLLVEYQK